MRNMLILAALVLCAEQAGAQQGDAAAPGQAAGGFAVVQARASVERAPSLFVGTEEVRSRIRQAEPARRAEDSQIENRDAWALGTAIALAVLMILIFTS